jgi:hypothetical protein
MNHYTQSLPEQELYTLDEKKLSEDEEEEFNHMTFREFYKIVDDLKKLHPTFRAQDFKAFMKQDEFKDQYDDIVFAYLDDFGYPDLSNDYVKDVVIALSTIGIEIPQKPRVKNNSVNEDEEEENNNVVDNKDELLSKDGIFVEEVSEIKQEEQEV